MTMISRLFRCFRAPVILLAASAVSGCAGLSTLKSATEPTDLYVLTPKTTHDADLPAIAAQLVIEEPTAAGGVNTDRIAVKPNPYQIQYFPGARWVDRAPLLVQTMLVESFESTGKVASVGRQAIGLRSDFTLLTELREFQAEIRPTGDASASVIIQLNMKIVQEPEGLIVASQTFAHSVPADSADMLSIVAAFDKALGQSMREAIDWTVRRIAGISGGSG
jgi:cholesterol transport system auxiliary component